MKHLFKRLDQQFLEGGDPAIVPVLRIGYASLMLIHLLTLWPHAEMWFTDQGVMTTQTAQSIRNANHWSILFLLPSSLIVVKLCLGCMAIHALCLLLGLASRLQALFLFVWLVSFQNRNGLILDGEDTLMRLYAFFFIWLPLDQRFSLTKQLLGSSSKEPEKKPWALNLIQFQMIALYASTALCKLQGDTWHNGTAMWYVAKMTDNFGRMIPATLFDSIFISAFSTWGALLLELALPILLILPQTRKWGMMAGILLHLGIEFTMNLFLFQWFMILGLLSFLRVEDWRWISQDITSKLFVLFNKS